MFIPIFILGLILWLGLARLVLRLVKLEHRKKVWRWFLVVTLAICTFDHLAGIIYAHVWVAMAQGKHNMTLKTDSMVWQSIARGKPFSFMKEPTDWQPTDEFWLVVNGFSKLQVVATSDFESDDLSNNAYELVLTNNAGDVGCKQFFALPKSIKQVSASELGISGIPSTQDDLLQRAAKSIQHGEQARCISIRPIPRISARYLSKHLTIISNFSSYPIIPFEYRYTKIKDLVTNQVLCENRHIVFWGGWVLRYFWIDPNTGKPPGYWVDQSGICEIVPTGQQQVQH